MANTVVAVFDELNEAQGAVDELLVSGFDRNEVKLASEDGSRQDFGIENRTEGGVKGFFKNLFGNDERTSLYDEAVKHGNYVVTAMAESDEKSAIASDIMTQHHPIDVEQRWQEWFPGDTSMSLSNSELNDSTIGRITDSETQSIPVVEERVKIGKREFERGGVRVYQTVTETPVQQDLTLKDEQVIVDRVRVDRPATGADFKNETIELRELAEEAVVQKEARVVEEVRVGKKTQERTQRIDETERRTDVQVEDLAGSDPYRSHWQENYASLGTPWEDYAQAYEYGSSASKLYAGRGWNDIEPDLHRDWQLKHPNSKWERFKDAVKHAFTGRR